MRVHAYILDAPYAIDRPFDYISDIPLKAGDIVRLPFGKANRLRLGIIVATGVPAASVENIKPVHSVAAEQFALSDEMLGLCLFLKEHTLCTFGEAVRAVLPPGALSGSLNVSFKRTCTLLLPPDRLEALLSAKGRQGIRSEGQRLVLEYLSAIGSADWELVRAKPGVTPAHIAALASKGIIEITAEEEIRNPYADMARERDCSEIILSEAQTRAFDTIRTLYEERKPRAALLYGITGSGKTKVIMKAIDRVLLDGRGVIMLVPEISLTPQTVRLFCTRYGERVAVVHSSLSQGERTDAWRRIRRGEVDLVIGTRSAIFAPMENLGMIVIDEEHEHTYKSESDPKYHARDVAAYRCAAKDAMMLLASATPSIESFYKAKTGKYTLVPLRERYGGAKLPRAVIVDMREELRLGNTSPVSRRLMEQLEGVKERGEQAILFLNRRGYSSQISCRECGEVISCPRCSVSLTYHSDSRGGRMLCHLCGFSSPAHSTCPSCGGENLAFIGYGTQKLEGELNKYLPDMPLLRMDADTTGGRMAYERMLEQFRNGRQDILLGTQMVAKGHDFPRVTLVGVVLADTSLFVSDFRAAERTFSLLTQVIGRAGRASNEGIAIIQTLCPTNETLRLACKQDYDSFYEGEIAIRRELTYPPFCDIVQLTVTADDEAALNEGAKALSESVLELVKGEFSSLPFVVFGPFEAQVYKLNEKYRMRMVIKCRLNSDSRRMLGTVLRKMSSHRGVSVSIDLNPLGI